MTGQPLRRSTLAEVLESTELGSGLFVTKEQLTAAVDALVPVIKGMQAHAIYSVAWQIPGTIEPTKKGMENYLLEVADSVAAGTQWMEE